VVLPIIYLKDLKLRTLSSTKDMMISTFACRCRSAKPAELLMSKKDTLFHTLKTQYDYIIVDTAPVSLVADTLLIAKHADTLFMWLSQLLEKRMLNIANNLYKEQNCQTCVCF
jgi:Mrp family chromosome partitioning ATPase